MTANIKKIFILLFVIGLLLPRLPLGNSNDTESENNPLSYINWKNEVFQEKFTSNFNKCFNNLDFLTKLKNQIEYSFFDRSKVIDLFIGDGGNIFYFLASFHKMRYG